MGNVPPDYCHYCGGVLSPVDPPTAHRCDGCGECVFYNPVPTSRVAVLDGDAVLLVRVDDPDRDCWGTPGGVVEAAEDPDVTGARELAEETSLTVAPDDLVLFDARTFVKFEATHKTYLAYAVAADDVDGDPTAGAEVAAARYWTPAELAAADAALLSSWPAAYRSLDWWVDNARAALADTR